MTDARAEITQADMIFRLPAARVVDRIDYLKAAADGLTVSARRTHDAP